MTTSWGHRLRSAAAGARVFLVTGLWQLPIEDLPRWKIPLVKASRAVMMALFKFFKDQCLLHASALTLVTLLSIVPLFAVIFGVAQGFGIEALLKKQLQKHLAGQEQAMDSILAFSHGLLENTQGEVMAGVGLLLMFFSAIKVLGFLEAAFNAIWEVTQARSWWRKFSDYLAVMVFGPALLIVSGGVTVFIRTQIDAAATRFDLGGWLSPLVLAGFSLTPLILIWALFTLLFLVMPNTRVSFKSALAGGVIGGSLFYLIQSSYIALQIGVAKFNAIYGSFAAVPLFMVWVQTSWILLLIGAELCFAFDKADTFCQATGCPDLSPGERRLLVLRIARQVIQNFAAGREPLTVAEMARGLRMPARLIQPVVAQLTQAGLFTETRSRKDRLPAFQPATDIRRLTPLKIIEASEGPAGGYEASPVWAEEARDLQETLQALHLAAAQSPANRPLMADTPP
jgi:membrane protein